MVKIFDAQSAGLIALAGLLSIWNVLFAYLSANIFLVGVQADELMRKGASSRRGLRSGVRAVTGG